MQYQEQRVVNGESFYKNVKNVYFLKLFKCKIQLIQIQLNTINTNINTIKYKKGTMNI